MKTEAIPDRLEYFDGMFPRQALAAAMEQRETIIPELLRILEYAADHIDALLDDPDHIGYLYAMLLLAQFREQRAYPILIRLLSNPSEDVDALLGDVMTEDLDRMLASVCGEDIDPIKTLIENEQVNEYVRSAGLGSLRILVARGVKSRDEILGYFQSLFQRRWLGDNEFLWAVLVSVSADLYPDVVYEDIRQAFAEDRIDPMFTDLDAIDEEMAGGKEAVLADLEADQRYRFIDDTIAELQGWAMFQPSKPVAAPPLFQKSNGQIIRAERKIGRNEPCPCGSGLKYKRCCGKGL